MMEKDFQADIKLNSVKNATLFQNETQIFTFPKWLQQIPERLLNISSQTDILKMEIQANMNKPESSFAFFTFLLSLLTIIFLTLLVLLLACFFCWKMFKSRRKYIIKKSKKFDCESSSKKTLKNYDVTSLSKTDCSDSKQLKKKIEIECDEKISIDKYEKPPRRGTRILPSYDVYCSKDSYTKDSKFQKKNYDFENYGFDSFEQKKTFSYPIEVESPRQIIKESYDSITLKNEKIFPAIDVDKRSDCSLDDAVLETRSYEIGKC